jgi:hypothetical protein
MPRRGAFEAAPPSHAAWHSYTASGSMSCRFANVRGRAQRCIQRRHSASGTRPGEARRTHKLLMMMSIRRCTSA